MSRFKFQFESVLKHRQDIQNEAQENFVLERLKYDEILREVETLREEMIRVSNLLGQGEFEYANHYLAMSQYHKKLTKDLRLKEKEAEIQKKELLKAKDELFEATKELKIIEKLKEKQFEAYKKEEKLKEGKFLDELVSMKSARTDY